MATGGDGYSTFLRGTNLLGGAQDIDALVAYMSNFKAPNPAYDPNQAALGKPRIVRINAPAGSTTCPGGSNTNP
jgi:5'-nucleotidase